MTIGQRVATPWGIVAKLNGRYHRPALMVFMVIVLAHWAEHITQAIQIWGLGWKTPDARGVLGLYFPVLVTQEWLHYGYALVMLAGLWILRHGFVGRAATWWRVALAVQIWHHLEHALLLVQVLVGANLAGRAVPTSILQLMFPRVELHLFYNAIVFAPMVVAVYLHLRPRADEAREAHCGCARAADPPA